MVLSRATSRTAAIVAATAEGATVLRRATSRDIANVAAEDALTVFKVLLTSRIRTPLASSFW